jgi:hypothetical protein
VALDGDPALALEVHVVQLLVHLFPFPHRLGEVEEAVREGTLTVVDVGNYTEVSNVLHIGHKGNFNPFG